jgi:hypothetical protein
VLTVVRVGASLTLLIPTVSVAVYYDAAGTTGAQITTAAGQEVVANVNQWKVLGHDATKAVVICAEFQ